MHERAMCACVSRDHQQSCVTLQDHHIVACAETLFVRRRAACSIRPRSTPPHRNAANLPAEPSSSSHQLAVL